MNETILSVLQCDGDQGRVVLVHRQSFGSSELLLRRESFSEDVGWFEQSTIELSPGQLGQLKQALGVLPATKLRPAAAAPVRRWGAVEQPTAASSKDGASERGPRFPLVAQIAG